VNAEPACRVNYVVVCHPHRFNYHTVEHLPIHYHQTYLTSTSPRTLEPSSTSPFSSLSAMSILPQYQRIPDNDNDDVHPGGKDTRLSFGDSDSQPPGYPPEASSSSAAIPASQSTGPSVIYSFRPRYPVQAERQHAMGVLFPTRAVSRIVSFQSPFRQSPVCPRLPTPCPEQAQAHDHGYHRAHSLTQPV
jgi:hypothetical protein